MRKFFLRMGAVYGFLAVVIGAFGAHSLESLAEVGPEQMETFETGVRYHFYHTFTILLIGTLLHFGRKKLLVIAAWFFAAGIFLFSGSLYLLSIREVLDLGNWLGPITPIGGTLFIIGWALFFVSTFFSFDRNGTAKKD